MCACNAYEHMYACVRVMPMNTCMRVMRVCIYAYTRMAACMCVCAYVCACNACVRVMRMCNATEECEREH